MKNMLNRIRSKFFVRPGIPVKTIQSRETTSVDRYWGVHTVNSIPFETEKDSINYLNWRFDEYPMFRELMNLWGNHDDQVVLDYGCGPGNDLVGFLVHTDAKKVIGIDISKKALNLASQRLTLHNIKPERVELIHKSDSDPLIPLDSHTIDYIYCEGVLHHTTAPAEILREFHRILRPDGTACIMVYNRNSIWFHLYTAYEKVVSQNAFPGLRLEDAFARTTDGENCPIAICYSPGDFVNICEQSGFKVEFKGGYVSKHEITVLERLGSDALKDGRLAEEHKDFLRNLTFDAKGLPLFQGKYAGIGGVYSLQVKGNYFGNV